MTMKTIKIDNIFQMKSPKNFTGIAIQTNGRKGWFKNGKLHRENGPAIIWEYGEKMWCQNGKLHRPDGPAIIKEGGEKKYFIFGKHLTEEQFKIFQFLWKNTFLERTNESMEIFFKLAKTKKLMKTFVKLAKTK